MFCTLIDAAVWVILLEVGISIAAILIAGALVIPRADCRVR